MRFEWQDVKRRRRELETMSDGAEKNVGQSKETKARRAREREGLKDRVIIKMLVYVRPAESCLCPEGHRPAPPLNSTAARAPNRANSGRRAAGRGPAISAGPHKLLNSGSQQSTPGDISAVLP